MGPSPIASQGPLLLQMHKVSASYGQIQALDGLSLSVAKGEIVALLGPNGGGKSTTLRVLLGLHRPTTGQVLLDGNAVERLPTEAIVRLGLAMVPEGRGVLAGMSVRENLLMGTYSRKVNHNRRQFLLDEVCDLFPVLRDRLDLRAVTLSGGQKQMLVIARALMAEPRLLVLDEPSFGLAPLVVREVFQTLELLRRERGLTVLVAEQLAANALRVLDRGYVIYRGRVVLEGSQDYLGAAGRLESAYLGSV